MTAPVWNTLSPTSRLSLWKEDVHVWHVPLSSQRALLPEWTRMLSVQERLKAAGLLSEYGLLPGEVCEMTREHYITYRGALRWILAHYLSIAPGEVIIRANQQGKPYLDASTGGDTVQFSASHSWGHALIAVTYQRTIGIDLQRIDPNGNIEQIAENRFSLQTQATFNTLPSHQRLLAFFRLWCLHEAYFKYLGGGVSWKDFTISLASTPDEPALLLETPRKKDVSLPCCLYEIDSGLPGYTAALAITG